MLESLLAFFPVRATIRVDLIGGLRAKLLAQEAISFSAASASAVAINLRETGIFLGSYQPLAL